MANRANTSHMSEEEKALVALSQLASWRTDDRDAWLEVGMALHSVSEGLLGAWDEWSRQSAKYTPNECARQWRSFKSDGGLGLGSLIRWTRDDGATDDTLRAPVTRRLPRKAQSTSAKPPKAFHTPEELWRAAALQAKGTFVEAWHYGPSYAVGRFDLPGVDKDGKPEKTFRPTHLTPFGWVQGDPDEPLPLYAREELLADSSSVVYLCEGEKAADALRHVGLLATTTAHGAQSPQRTDLTPLAGREVCVLPDNDEPGRKYAEKVGDLLLSLTPPARVKVVDLPGLPVKGDAFDYVESLAARGQDAHETIRNLCDRAPFRSRRPAAPARKQPPFQPLPDFVPFPTEVLPEKLGQFVLQGAEALGVDSSYIALPLLSGMASAIGNTRRISAKRSWCAPAVVWTIVVGESGTLKSPAIALVLEAVFERHRAVLKAHEEEKERYKAALREHRLDLKKWEKEGRDRGEDQPLEPNRPVFQHVVCSDITVEALADRLLKAPRGLLLARDELSGWLGSFNQYKAGKGHDEAHWLNMFDAGHLLVDRKTGNRTNICVPRAAVSITGGIQPAILGRMLTNDKLESGLAARFLMTMPPRRPKRWSDAEVPEFLKRQLAEVYARLWGLTMTKSLGQEAKPLVLPLSAEARECFKVFVNEHGEESNQLTGSSAAAFSKLEGYALRLALVVALAQWASEPMEDGHGPLEVGAGAVRAGIELVRWAKHETLRVYQALRENPSQTETRRTLELIERRPGDHGPGTITVRELQQSRHYRSAAEAKEHLNRLVGDGLGRWVDCPSGSKGGRPTQYFQVINQETSQ